MKQFRRHYLSHDNAFDEIFMFHSCKLNEGNNPRIACA